MPTSTKLAKRSLNDKVVLFALAFKFAAFKLYQKWLPTNETEANILHYHKEIN